MPCRTLAPREITITITITITVTALPEEIPVQGNAICSGDEDFDREVESEIFRRLENGDVWAWATVCVSAEWEALKENEYLGCCCYESEEDFRNNSGYFEEMVDEVLANLNKRIQNLYEKMAV